MDSKTGFIHARSSGTTRAPPVRKSGSTDPRSGRMARSWLLSTLMPSILNDQVSQVWIRVVDEVDLGLPTHSAGLRGLRARRDRDPRLSRGPRASQAGHEPITDCRRDRLCGWDAVAKSVDRAGAEDRPACSADPSRELAGPEWSDRHSGPGRQGRARGFLGDSCGPSWPNCPKSRPRPITSPPGARTSC